jgi:hypothetical protein
MVEAKLQAFREAPGKFRVPGSGKSWAPPVVIGGRMHIHYHDGLHCYDVRGPAYEDYPTAARRKCRPAW